MHSMNTFVKTTISLGASVEEIRHWMEDEETRHLSFWGHHNFWITKLTNEDATGGRWDFLWKCYTLLFQCFYCFGLFLSLSRSSNHMFNGTVLVTWPPLQELVHLSEMGYQHSSYSGSFGWNRRLIRGSADRDMSWSHTREEDLKKQLVLNKSNACFRSRWTAMVS